jgi:spore coat protein U-like protein
MKLASPRFALGFLVSVLASGPALAATPSISFGVTATIQSGCLVSVTARVSTVFTSAVANAASAVSVTCTNPTPYNVNLSTGMVWGPPWLPGR